MKREDLLKFGHRDEDFMKKIYPILNEKEKRALWVDSLTFDFRSGFADSDPPINKFNNNNYEQWKIEEPNFDRYLEYIIDEFLTAWVISRDEIYKRIGKKKMKGCNMM